MNCKEQAVKKGSLEFIESLENVNTVLLRQNDSLKEQVKKLKQENCVLRDELMSYKFNQVAIGRARSISIMSIDLKPIKRDVIDGLHFHTKYIENWKFGYEPFKVDMKRLYMKKSVDFEHLFREYKRFKLYKLKQSTIKHADQSLAQLHQHLEHLKVYFLVFNKFIVAVCACMELFDKQNEMKRCQLSFEQNEKKGNELLRSLKSTQLKKVTLMERYDDIFNEFQDLVETESSLKDKREETKQKYEALCVKSDELLLTADQIVDCIQEYKAHKKITTQHNNEIQQFFDQQWLRFAQNSQYWPRSTILLWLKYKMKWFKDNDREQQRREFEVQHTMTKYNISGKNLVSLCKYLGNAPHWKRQIGQHIRALHSHQILFKHLTPNK